MVLKFALIVVALLQCGTALRMVTRTTTNTNHALISSTRLNMFNFGKKKETPPPSPPRPAAEEGKQEDKSKELVRRALWATTPWIFNDYEDTKNYVDGKKTVKVVVKEKTVDGGLGSFRDRERDRGAYESTGTYNMMDSSRAPVVSGSVQDALFKNKGKAGPSGQPKVEAPKVGLIGNAGLKVAQVVQGGGAGVLPDINKYKRPSKTLLLYEYEGSPFCKKVREACSLLDVIVEYRPCPSARYGFSDQLATRTQGDRTVPFFYDPNNSIGGLNSLQDADAIVDYLFDYYGPGSENMPANLKKKVGGTAAAAKFTGGAGGKLISTYKSDNIFRKPIDLWGYEGAATVKPVRETLCGLALAHRYVHCAKGSKNVDKLVTKGGQFGVPYIEDPNTGKKLSGSAEIVKYLTETYTSK